MNPPPKDSLAQSADALRESFKDAGARGEPRSTRLRDWFRILYQAVTYWTADNAFKQSAAVSFYTLFSLAPVSIIAVWIIAFFMGHDEAERQFGEQIAGLVGSASAQAILHAKEASQAGRHSWISTTTGTVLSIVSATAVFSQLQGSLNELWRVKAKPSRNSWVILIVQRLISFAMVVTIGFILMVSLFLTTALIAIVNHLHSSFEPAMAQVIAVLVGLILSAVLFCLMFKIMPDVRLRWRDVTVSALLTSLLFTVGRYLIALYLAHSNVAAIYGAAGSLVALLIWVYYSCAILFFGVECTRAYRAHWKLPTEPKDTAVVIREEIVERAT